jgi:hypothetical protein
MQQIVDCPQGEIRGAYPVIGAHEREASKYYFYTDFRVTPETLTHCRVVAGRQKEIAQVHLSDHSEFGGIMVIFKGQASKELVLLTVGTYVHNLRHHFNGLEAMTRVDSSARLKVSNAIDPFVHAMAVNDSSPYPRDE